MLDLYMIDTTLVNVRVLSIKCVMVGGWLLMGKFFLAQMVLQVCIKWIRNLFKVIIFAVLDIVLAFRFHPLFAIYFAVVILSPCWQIYDQLLINKFSVANCFFDGVWAIPLRHLTSDRACSELTTVRDLIESWFPDEGVTDGNVWKMNQSQQFSVRALYHLENFGRVLDQAASAVWSCSAPNKNKIFAWLWVKWRIKVRSVLFKQHILDFDGCPFGCNVSETHLAIHCPRSAQVFQMLGIDTTGVQKVGDLFTLGKDHTAPDKSKAWEVVVITILWNWLARNRKVFDDRLVPPSVVVIQCAETLRLWSHRLKRQEKQAALKWIEDWLN